MGHDIKALIKKFWWVYRSDQKKIHWLKWEKMTKSKMDGGMGFKDLRLILMILCWLNKCGGYCIANPPFSTRCLKLFFWTKHIFIFTYNIFSFFPVDPSPFSLSSDNFRFLVLLQHLFQIGIHLLHTKTIAFLFLSLPNFRFLFSRSRSTSLSQILEVHQSEIHIY